MSRDSMFCLSLYAFNFFEFSILMIYSLFYSCGFGSRSLGQSVSSFFIHDLSDLQSMVAEPSFLQQPIAPFPTPPQGLVPLKPHRWWSSQEVDGSRIHTLGAMHAMVAEPPFLQRPIAPFTTPPQGLVPLNLARRIHTPPACLCRDQLFVPIEDGERCHVCDRSASYMILEHMVFWCPTHADVLRALHPCSKHIKFLGSFPKMSNQDYEHAHHHGQSELGTVRNLWWLDA
jgi:hypothetical protein